MDSAAPVPFSGGGVSRPPASSVLPLDFGQLRALVAGYLRPEDIGRIEAAYHFAADAHTGQLRKSGEPYISHPVAVAEILAGRPFTVDERLKLKGLTAFISKHSRETVNAMMGASGASSFHNDQALQRAIQARAGGPVYQR